jgi:hypothetical protein
LNQENQFGPWFTLSDTEKQQIGSPMGPQNPQALNRYSYVLNNPVNKTDPSGHMPPDVVLCTFDAACRERVWHSVVSLVDTAVFVTVRLFGGDVAYYGDKIANQMPKRGWSEEDMRQTLSHPADTAKTINKATGNSATKYYNSEGHYIVRDDVTDEIIQVSNRNDSHWIDDLTNQPIKPRQ